MIEEVLALFLSILLAAVRMVVFKEDAEEVEGEAYSEGVFAGILLGVFLVILALIVYYVWDRRRKRLELPSVIIINPIDGSMAYVGKFKRVRKNITVPVTDSSHKSFWSLDTDFYSIMPAYGNYADLIIEDDAVPTLKLIMAEIIGMTRDGQEVVKRWASYAFPTSVWEIPPELDMSSVAPNYVLVRPLYKREWGPIIFRNGLAAIRNVFGEVARIRGVADRELEVLNENWGRMIASTIISADEMVISMYFHALELWDTISEQRVLPWEVLGRLTHQPMDQLNLTGLQYAIQGGNMREVGSQVIRSYRKMLEAVAGEFNYTLMSEPVAKALMGKLNAMQEKVAASVRRDYEMQRAGIPQLLNQMQALNQAQQGQGQSSGPPANRPTVDMWNKAQGGS